MSQPEKYGPRTAADAMVILESLADVIENFGSRETDSSYQADHVAYVRAAAAALEQQLGHDRAAAAKTYGATREWRNALLLTLFGPTQIEAWLSEGRRV